MIIAIKEKDNTVVGFSNTEFLFKFTNADYIDKENLPIRFTENGKLLGFTYMNRISDMFLYDENFLNIETNEKNIVREFIPFIKKKLKENNLTIDNGTGWENSIIICDNNHLYDVDTKFGFSEIDDYVCHGLSYNVESIRSVLDLTKNMPAKQRIIEAVNFTSKLIKRSLFPLVMVDTKNQKFEYILKGEKEIEYFDSL